MSRLPSIRRVLSVPLFCALLAACGGQPLPPDNNAPLLQDQSMAEREESAPARENTPEPPAPVRQAAIDPASLVGMTGVRITSLFGDPVFVRRDGAGEFWRYRGKSCVLELFFYAQGGGQRVHHMETRLSGGKKINQTACVAALRRKPS